MTNNKQKGAALMVGLIMMLVLTILGISAMQMSRAQLSMAGNDQFHAQAMNLAEAAINAQIAANNFNIGTTLPGNAVQVTPTQSGAGSSTIQYLNEGSAPDGGFSDGTLTYRFQIEAQARTPAPGPIGTNTRARVQLIQGIYVLAPGS